MTIALKGGRKPAPAHPLPWWERVASAASRVRGAGHRRAMTLVELLVVIGIILMLAAIAIPAFQPAAQRQPMREAARGLSAFLQAARVDAMELGRPVGVAFQRLAQNPNACFVVHQVEIPPTYAGESMSARVRPAVNPPGVPPLNPPGPMIVAMVSVGAISDGLIRPGDLVQLNHQGPWYQVAPLGFGGNAAVNPDSNNNGYLDFTAGDTNSDGFHDGQFLALIVPAEVAASYTPPWPQAPQFGPAVSFLIERIPNLDAASGTFGGALLLSTVPPLRLTGGAVIDLVASGTAGHPNGFEAVVPGDTWPTILVFAPDGSVQRVYHQHVDYNAAYDQVLGAGFASHPVTEPLYFLVGSWQRMCGSARDLGGPYPKANPAYAPSMADDGLYNWQDPENVWVVLNPQTGSITQADVYATSAAPIPGGDPAAVAASIVASRGLAREVQMSKGGR